MTARYIVCVVIGFSMGWALRIGEVSFAQTVIGSNRDTTVTSSFDCDGANRQISRMMHDVAQRCPIQASPK